LRVIEPSFEIIHPDPEHQLVGQEMLVRLEEIARTCYKSEDKITEGSAEKLVKALVKRKHFPMLDHFSITVRIICDRGVTHEIVRHRIAAYAQESTRFCNYSKEKYGDHLTFIKPCFFPDIPTGEFNNASDVCLESNDQLGRDAWLWLMAMENAEHYYLELIKEGASPGEARSVLPNSLKTEIVCTLDITAWRHFFTLRTASGAHAQMREITQPMLRKFRELFPIVFDGVGKTDEEDEPGS
jgi:thymidylate synthase (FAD)